MDLRFVSSLLAVVDHDSIAAAARVEGITASAVTQRVASLEAELKAPLLRRSGRVMQATPQCLVVLPQLRQLVATQAALRLSLQDQVLAGPFRLGAISTALGDYAPALVKVLRDKAPKVDLHLVPGTSRQLFAGFEEKRLDAVLIVQPPFELPKTMQFTPLADQRVCLMTPEGGHPNEVLPYLVYSREAWGGASCWTALTELEPQPRILAEMDAVETIVQMVQDGVGCAVLPDWQGRAERFPHVEVTELEAPERTIGLLSWVGDRDRPVLDLVQRHLTRS